MLDKFLINFNASINDVIKKIEANSKGFVLVEDDSKCVLGTVTDGDIRRSLIAGAKLNDLVLNYTNKKFVFLDDNSIDHESIYKKLDQEITFIPVLDSKHRLLRFITKDTIPSRFEKLITARSKSPVRVSFGGGGSDTTSYFKNNNGAVLNSTINLYRFSQLRLFSCTLHIDSILSQKSSSVILPPRSVRALLASLK